MQVFAYGQTGAGKTYVMGTAATNDQITSPREENGVIPRGISYLFSKMDAIKKDHLVSLRVSKTLCLCACSDAGSTGLCLMKP